MSNDHWVDAFKWHNEAAVESGRVAGSVLVLINGGAAVALLGLIGALAVSGVSAIIALMVISRYLRPKRSPVQPVAASRRQRYILLCTPPQVVLIPHADATFCSYFWINSYSMGWEHG